jgi:hypothetical protein
MGWFDDLRSAVTQATSQTTSGLKRFAGQAVKSLDSPFVRPMIGLKPELGGVVASMLLPEGNPAKQVLDAGLYLASGPLSMTAGLAGSSPQSDDPYGNWQRLGYKSREDMVSRVAKQQAADQALASRPPRTYIADDYGPPRPVKYDDGTILVGDYRVDRFNSAPASTGAGAAQARPDATAPATRRPVEEQRPPVTREVPASPTPQPQSMNELAQTYARQRVLGAEMAKGGELQRRLYEGGAAEGMPVEKFMTWVEANPDLAYRLAEKRGLLPDPA